MTPRPGTFCAAAPSGAARGEAPPPPDKPAPNPSGCDLSHRGPAAGTFLSDPRRRRVAAVDLRAADPSCPSIRRDPGRDDATLLLRLFGWTSVFVGLGLIWFHAGRALGCA